MGGSTIAAAVDILSNECDGQCTCSPTEFPELQCDSPCMFDGETHSCRDRVQWVVRERGSTIAAALDNVSQECDSQCTCSLTEFPELQCDSPCMFDGEIHSCRERVQWLVRERGSTIAAALPNVSQECGGQCICGAADFEASTEAPSTEVPSTEVPGTEAPSTEALSIEAPSTEATTRRCCGDQCSPDSPEYDPDTEQCCGEGEDQPVVCGLDVVCPPQEILFGVPMPRLCPPLQRCCGASGCHPSSPVYDPDTEQCCGEGTFVFTPTVCSKESGCCPSGYSRSPQCFDASSEQCCGWNPHSEGALVCSLDVTCPSFEGYSTACPSLVASASLRGSATGGEQLLP